MVLVLLAVVACSPAPTQPPVEIAPLPTPPASSGPPPSLSHRPMHHRDPADPIASGPDRDGDGVPDDVDKCPDEPEDRDGFQDDDGCPDPDNDRDGVLDAVDQCPNEPGPAPTGCPGKHH